uniref:Secreted protein n=1 Tax=Ascaris lumbricoides TaxID=6252 RepID=A0A0M3HTI8_ASCLU
MGRVFLKTAWKHLPPRSGFADARSDEVSHCVGHLTSNCVSFSLQYIQQGNVPALESSSCTDCCTLSTHS